MHITQTSNVDLAYLRKHTGSLLSPAHSFERAVEIGVKRLVDPSTFTVINVQGRGWREAAEDVVFAGLGWVALTGAGEVRIQVGVGTHEGVMAPYRRFSLMPFEAKSSGKRWTGTPVAKVHVGLTGPEKRRREKERAKEKAKRKRDAAAVVDFEGGEEDEEAVEGADSNE